eukprot:2079181-Amphidinium_carterae.1
MQLSLTPLQARADRLLPARMHDLLQPGEVPVVHLVERSENAQPLDLLVVDQMHQLDIAQVVQDALRPVRHIRLVLAPPVAGVLVSGFAIDHEQPHLHANAA